MPHPLKATIFEMERLRCNACGQVFTAAEPETAGPEKYDATAVAMIALLKYGTGVPVKGPWAKAETAVPKGTVSETHRGVCSAWSVSG
jgi:hypothetical protein